ncbi:MAG: leucyl/phenylalanyl-tRNA--protein transferase [Alphaproteobacteria bacterium]|nr:leucyl/phenylalanyl-tRNA--protein transferase [Alphaproteobacteria bacterium]
MSVDPPQITPELLLHAYASGVFPMSEGADADEVYWVDPKARGILPVNGFHISRSLSRKIRTCGYDIRVDSAFSEVVTACADRPETWINSQIFGLYAALFDLGFAHSLEVFDGENLIGGIYGVALGAAFFGESMFSRATDGSKIALAYLVDRLRAGGFTLFDTQFITPHLHSLGGREITRDDYHARLASALQVRADFMAQPSSAGTATGILQRNTQTS